MNTLLPGLPVHIYNNLSIQEMPTWARAVTSTGTARGHRQLRSSAAGRHNTASVTRLLSDLDSFDPVVILLPQLHNLSGMLMCDRYGWIEPQSGNECGTITVEDADLKRNNLLMFCVTQNPAQAVALVAQLLAMCDSSHLKDVIFVGEGIVYLQLHEPQENLESRI
jgi:hypothetical protein